MNLKKGKPVSRWVADSEVSSCSICEVPFTMFTRKHHCRSCGKIFCYQCTSKRRPMKHLGYKGAVRLCDICDKDISLCAADNVGYEKTNITHSEILKEWIILITTVDYTKELETKILMGIPNTLRSLVWTELCHANSIILKNSGLYEIYLSKPNTEVDEFIALDIPRTILDHPRFGSKGNHNKAVENVLRAFANFSPEVGYRQGMAWIAAALLIHMNEENAFWVFVQMMKKYYLGDFFVKEETEMACARDFINNFHLTLPQLEKHIVAHGAEPILFARQWIRTLFVPDFDLAIVFRLWDIFFVEKLDFFFNFVLTMFTQSYDKILSISGPKTLLYINSLPKLFQDSNIDDLISHSVRNHASMRTLGIPYTLKGIKKL